MTTQDCDMFVASTMAVPAAECARDNFAWSECDDEPYCLDYADEPDEVESSSRWLWVLVIGAWAAGALTLAVVVGMAFVAFTPQQPSTTPHSSTVTPPSTDPPYPFVGIDYGSSEPPRNT